MAVDSAGPEAPTAIPETPPTFVTVDQEPTWLKEQKQGAADHAEARLPLNLPFPELLQETKNQSLEWLSSNNDLRHASEQEESDAGLAEIFQDN